MNRIVLIGNGFDLAHGLPTRYENFIDWYWMQLYSKLKYCNKNMLCDTLCSFILKDDSSTWRDCLFYWPKKYEKVDFIDRIRDNQEICFFKQCSFFYEICKTIEIKNWVDIENEYYKFLNSFLADIPKCDTPDILNKELDFIKLKLIEYLTLVQKSQIQGLHINKDIKKEILSPLNNKEISLSSSAKRAWKDFIEGRKKVTEEEWKKLLKNYDKNRVDERFIEIATFMEKRWGIIFEDGIPIQKYVLCCRDRQRGEVFKDEGATPPVDFLRPDKIMLLNFNYTKTADMYLPEVDPDCFWVNHIHGELSKPESVIFGYGDELDDNYKKILKLGENEYLQNMKSIKYLEAYNYRRMLYFLELAPYQVCIMGHSCGNSDRTLLNTLFEHKNCVSVKPFFYKKEDGSDNYLEIVQNVCRNFKDMKLMRSRVVNKTLCAPFSMQK